MPAPDALITLRLYGSLFEARLAQAELETFEIDVFLPDERTLDVNWPWRNLLGGVKLQVPESQAVEANGVLSADRVEHDLPPAPAMFCVNCGGANTHYFLSRRGAILTWLLLGIPIVPVVSKQVCGDCGHKWRVSV